MTWFPLCKRKEFIMGNFYMEATQINYRRDDTLKTVDQKLQELSETSAIDTDIAPVFKSTETYHPGDLVYYRNKLYVFNVEHTGTWAAADVSATNVSSAMNTALASKADYDDIAAAFNSETAYEAGNLVNYNGTIYRCTNDHTGDWDADDFSATTIGAELNAINSNIASLFSNIQTAESFQGDSEVKYVVLGKVVVFFANITKNQSSWTIAYGLPKPYFSEAAVGYLEDNFEPKDPVFIFKDTSDGRLQVRSSSTSITNKRLYGVYLSE